MICVGNWDGQWDILVPGEGLTYMQVAVGDAHAVLLKNDGTVAACGANDEGQCDILVPGEGLTYM